MTLDPTVLPGLSLFALELLALAAVGFVVARVALGQADDRMALAQGMVIGPAAWGLVVNFVLHVVPGLAGALVGWVVIVVAGAGLAWRARSRLRVSSRTLAGFGAAALALFWIALASRQLLGIPDDAIHTALPATIRAGAYPPELAWNPDVRLAYHYGADLLIGLLTPPVGPDLAFVTELMGAYLWTGFVLVVVTLLRQHGAWLGVLMLALLLLTTGAWTLVWYADAPEILRVPIPAGVPMAGVRAALADIYWPMAELPRTWPTEATPPNIWKPPFLLGYALAGVILERLASRVDQGWPLQVGMALLVGFLGLVDETVALTVLGLWVILAVLNLMQARQARTIDGEFILCSAIGPALSAGLLAAGGGVLTGFMTGAPRSTVSFGWRNDPTNHLLFGSFGQLSGGVGVLGIGVIPVTVSALLLAFRQRLVVILVIATSVFVLAALTVQHSAHPGDAVRLDGHARNFGLLALLVALGVRLNALRFRWRVAASSCLGVLVIWPTVALPVQRIPLSLGQGIEVANAQLGRGEAGEPRTTTRRHVLAPSVSAAIVDFIRKGTAVDARVFSPHPHELTAATGRPNASGPVGHLNLLPFEGPEYDDVKRHLEPGAVRRLGYAYVHATDAWFAGLPEYAQQWLSDPVLFEPLIRDGTDTLYRIEPAFLRQDAVYARASFEALRRSVPASSFVYLASGTQQQTSTRRATIRLMMALSHTQSLGILDLSGVYLLTTFPVPTKPLAGERPDLVVLPARGLAPAAFAAEQRVPIWWNDEVAVYAPDGELSPLMDSPPSEFSVELIEARVEDGRISFAALFSNHVPGQWVGQDWLVTAGDGSPWAFAHEFETDARHKGRQWYGGQLVPGQTTASFRYELEAGTGRMSVGDARGNLVRVDSSGEGLGRGVWTLGVRLRHEWHEAAFIPVMKIVVAESGVVAYEVYEGELNARLAR